MDVIEKQNTKLGEHVMKKDWKREYFSIPNLMGYFRLILIPVYLLIYINAKDNKDYFLSALILLLSAITDFFDGKIARKFDMITEWGKMLDPIADKLTQGIVVISLIMRYDFMTLVLIVFLVQQVLQGVMGIVFIQKTKVVEGAQMFGKVSTAFMDFMIVVFVLWIDIPKKLALFMMTISIFLMANSLFRYIDFYAKRYKSITNKGER